MSIDCSAPVPSSLRCSLCSSRRARTPSASARIDATNDSATPKATLHKAQNALVSGSGVSKGTEVTPLLKQLALKLPRLHGAERKRAVGLLARPTQGEGSANELEYQTSEARRRSARTTSASTT